MRDSQLKLAIFKTILRQYNLKKALNHDAKLNSHLNKKRKDESEDSDELHKIFPDIYQQPTASS